MIADDFTYGHEGAAGFHHVFEDDGGKIVQKLWPPLNVADYALIWGSSKATWTHLCRLAGSNRCAYCAPYREYGFKMPVFGNPTLVDEGILKNMGDEALGVYSASWYAVDRNAPDNKRFVERSSRIQSDAGLLHRRHVHGRPVAGRGDEGDQRPLRRQSRIRARAAQREARPGTAGPIRLDEYGKPILNSTSARSSARTASWWNTTLETFPA